MISSTLVTGAPAAAAAAAANSAASANNPPGAPSLASNFNTFLTLLTTQIQNQDPLSPMDSAQFTNQLVSFSQVEQEINTNSNLQTLISMQNSSQAISALPLVGQTIQYNGATTPLVNGQAAFSYNLPTAASNANLVVSDSSGRTIYATAANTAAGQHSFTWNGQTNTGTTAPADDYTLSVQAVDANNSPITATVSAYGQVAGVSVTNNVATFNIGDIQVPMSELVSVGTPSS